MRRLRPWQRRTLGFGPERGIGGRQENSWSFRPFECGDLKVVSRVGASGRRPRIIPDQQANWNLTALPKHFLQSHIPPARRSTLWKLTDRRRSTEECFAPIGTRALDWTMGLSSCSPQFGSAVTGTSTEEENECRTDERPGGGGGGGYRLVRTDIGQRPRAAARDARPAARDTGRDPGPATRDESDPPGTRQEMREAIVRTCGRSCVRKCRTCADSWDGSIPILGKLRERIAGLEGLLTGLREAIVRRAVAG